SNLDAKLRHEMRETITDIHRRVGITTLYVTHDQKEALAMGTEISVMRLGELIQTGSPREVYHNPRTSFVASFMGETNLMEARFVAEEGPYWKLNTPLGSLLAAPSPHLKPHEVEMVSLR